MKIPLNMFTVVVHFIPSYWNRSCFQEEEDWELNKYVMDAYSKAPFLINIMTTD